MNWGKVILGGVVGGLVMNIADFVMHGLILGKTYTEHAAFAQEPANPIHFFAVALAIGVMAAILFSKTRSVWAAGAMGGATFGFFVGLVAFFQPFYNPLVIEGFPYFLAWCWGGTKVIAMVVLGAVLGLIIKS